MIFSIRMPCPFGRPHRHQEYPSCIVFLTRSTQIGRPMKRKIPFIIHSGEILPTYLRFGDYAGPPSSGNVYSRGFLEMIFPLPEAEWRYGSDSLPFHAAPLYGEIKTVPTFGAYPNPPKFIEWGIEWNFLFARPARCSSGMLCDASAFSRLISKSETSSAVIRSGHRHSLRSWREPPLHDKDALQSDFLAKCWRSCMTYPGYPAFVRIVLFLHLLGLHLENRLTVPAAAK